MRDAHTTTSSPPPPPRAAAPVRRQGGTAAAAAAVRAMAAPRVARLRRVQWGVLRRLLALDADVGEAQVVLRGVDGVCGGVVAAVACAAGLLAWERGPWFAPRPWAPDSYGADARSMTGLLLFASTAAVAVALLCGGAGTVLRHCVAYGGARATRRALLLYTVVAGAAAAVALLAALTWARAPLQCGVVGCVGRRHWTGRVERDHGMNVRLGLMLFVTLYPLSLVMACRAWLVWRQARRLHRDTPSPPHGTNRLQHTATTTPAAARACEAAVQLSSSSSPLSARASVAMRVYTTPRLRTRVAVLVAVVVGLLACGAVSCLLPNGGHDLTVAIIAYVAAQQPSTTATSVNATVPELPHARVLRTRAVRLSELVYLRLFPSNVLFYAYLLLVVLLVWTLRLSRRGRYWLHRRLPTLPWCGASLSVCEAVCVVLTALLCVLFTYYWVHNHNYKNTWREGAPVHGYMGAAEVWGRALGQLAVLLLSLLLFPISRHSVLFALLGVSWDSLLWLHRVLGYGMLLASLAHVVAFYVQYHEQGVLWHNLNALPNYVGQRKVRNDYTVQVATWATALLFTAMGPLALPHVRRRCYELFYYAHLFAAYVLIPVILWHATAGWQCMLPGLTLWCVDRLVRTFQGGALVVVRDARVVSEDVVRVTFVVPWWGCTALHPGHYVFVQVPELSSLQWHPMTLSNAVCPADGAVNSEDEADGDDGRATTCTIHVKRMGSGRSWTARLHRHIAAGRPMTLAVDGPCGTPLDCTHYDSIFFVCGGIGVTPCAALFGTLLRQCVRDVRRGGGACRPRRVRLLWMTRSAALVAAMAPTLGLPRSLRQCAYTPARARDADAAAQGSNSSNTSTAAAATANEAGDDTPPAAHDDKDDDDDDDERAHSSHASSAAAALPQLPVDKAEALAPGTTRVTTAAARNNDDVASITRGYFDCRLYVTDARSYAALRDVIGASPAAAATTGPTRGAFVDVAVRGGRGSVADELDLPRVCAARVPALPYDVQRTLVFVCGPASLVRDTTRVCTALGVHLHEETFLL